MNTTDWRELCRELVDAQDAHDATGRGMTEVLTRARAALAEPAPEGPTTGGKKPLSLVCYCYMKGMPPNPHQDWRAYFDHCAATGTISGLKLEAIQPTPSINDSIPYSIPRQTEPEGPTDEKAQQLFDSLRTPIYGRLTTDTQDRVVGHEPVRPGDFARAVLAVMADGPAVQSREPASVVGKPSDEELLELMPETMRDEFSYAAKGCADATGNQVKPGIFRVCLNTAALEYARAVLSRWSHQPAPAAEGEVGELVAELRMMASQAAPVPVAVSNRLPQPEDCDAEGRCWWGRPESDDWSADWTLATPEAIAEFCEFSPRVTWLPFNALSLPQGEVE